MISSDLVTRAVSQIRKSAANAEYFFEKLSSPEWLEPLKNAGFFSEPPPPIREGEYISFPAWPETRYLARMAAIESAAQSIFSIASKIPDTENVRVYHDLAEIAIALPPELGARFVPAAKRWIASPYQLLLPEQLGKLVQRLAENGKVRAAFDLASTLFELVPDSQGQAASETDERWRRDVRGHFDDWHYEKILRESTPALVRADGLRAVSMLAELLESALKFLHPEREGRECEDYSWVWRPAIEDHAQNSGHSAKDALVAGVRDAAELVVGSDGELLAQIVAQFEARRWTIFRRMALHIIATFAESHTLVAESRLTDRKLFDDVTVGHEYYYVARASFGRISARSQEVWLSYVEQGPDMEAAARWIRGARGHEPSPADLLRYMRTWQLKHLSAVKEALPPAWAERYEQWSKEYGEPEHPDFAAYHSSGWVGASSPKTADELRSLAPAELVEYLNAWEPSGRWGEPSREGLSNELKVLIALDPAKYAAAANGFRTVRPIFLRAFVSSLQTAAGQGKRFEWAPVLELFGWIVGQEVTKRARGDELADEDSSLGWTRTAIADFLSDALAHEQRSPPEALAVDVWKVLRPLTDDPDPTPEDEVRYGPPNMDPFTLSLNTTRGQALHGVVNYVDWRSRHTPAEEKGERTWVTRCPEAREVLQQHLDPRVDPSRAIRAVYGQHLPTLAYLDMQWLRTQLRAMFPEEADRQELRNAAWDAFVIFCNPQSALLPLLQGEYERAVQSLAARPSSKRGRDPAERLAEHVMVLYWWGDLDLAEQGLVQRFFEAATDDIREHAMDFIGRSLGGPEAPPPEVVRRLQLLWELRFNAAKVRPADHVEELSGFGWWFASGRFDYDWALAQLRAILRLTKKIEPAHKVIERLADSVSERPLQSLEAFEEIVDADKQGWLVSLAREDAERLLAAAVGREESRERAVEVLHRLGAKGYGDFRKLLPLSGKPS